MIVVLLVLILLALLFPGFMRMVALGLLLIAAFAVINPQRDKNSGSASVADEIRPTNDTALDFSRQVYTVKYAVICSQSVLLTETPENIYGMFTSVFSRAEKVAELGCTEYPDGVPVYARMMNPPFDGFVSVDFCDPKECPPQYFTMKANLRN